MAKTTSNIGVSMPAGYAAKLRTLSEQTHISLSKLVTLALEEKYQLKGGDNGEHRTGTYAISV